MHARSQCTRTKSLGGASAAAALLAASPLVPAGGSSSKGKRTRWRTLSRRASAHAAGHRPRRAALVDKGVAITEGLVRYSDICSNIAPETSLSRDALSLCVAHTEFEICVMALHHANSPRSARAV